MGDALENFHNRPPYSYGLLKNFDSDRLYRLLLKIPKIYINVNLLKNTI